MRRGRPNARSALTRPPDHFGTQAVASTRHVIIAGAGIGGLSAALALTRAGYRVTVLEQAPQLQETGAGIQLSPNAPIRAAACASGFYRTSARRTQCA